MARAGRKRVPVLYDANDRPIYTSGEPPYLGTSYARRAVTWSATSASLNSILSGSLHTLRARCRDIARKAPWVEAGVESFVTSAVGTGIRPLPNVKDPGLRRKIVDLWNHWAIHEADADGQESYYGLQALAVREQREAGECFIRFRERRPEDGLRVPFQIQMIESEQCDETYNDVLDSTRLVRLGIEMDPIGRRNAYWMWTNHPGDSLLRAGNLMNEKRAIPADNILHFYETLRAGQLRGAPPLAPILAKLKDLLDTDDAMLMRLKVASLFVGYLRKQVDESNPMGGGSAGYDEDDTPLAMLEPGMFQELLPGEDIGFSSPPDVGESFGDWFRMQLRSIASGGLGVTYEMMTGDLTQVNYSSIRAGMIWFRRSIRRFQQNVVIQKLCIPVWERWYRTAVLVGELPAPIDGVIPVASWVPTPGWDYIDPTKEQQARKDQVRAGNATRTRMILEDGGDPDVLDQERSEEIKRARALGLVFDTDPEQTDGSGRKQQEPKEDTPDSNAPARPKEDD